MADMKEIKITSSTERYAAKFHKALEMMQKGGMGQGGFTEKTFKSMNRELDKMVKSFSKIGVDVRDVAKSMSDTWAKGIKTNTKNLEQYGKLLKKTSEDAARAGAVASRLSDPTYRSGYINRYMANADKDPNSKPAEARARAEANLESRKAAAEAKRDAASDMRHQVAEQALQDSISSAEEKQAALRSKIVGFSSVATGGLQLAAMATQIPTERYRNLTQGTRTSAQLYDRFAQGDLAMAATMQAGGQEAIDAGERAQAHSWLQSGASVAGGALGATLLATGAVAGPIGITMAAGGLLAGANGLFNFATDKAGSEKQKATAEYLDLMNENDPVRKRVLTDAAQHATTYANYLGQFGGGADRLESLGNRGGRNFGTDFESMAGQAKSLELTGVMQWGCTQA